MVFKKTTVVALVGFVTATIVTKNAYFIIGIAVAAAIILINTIDAVRRVKTLDEWERRLDERERKLDDKGQSIQRQEWDVQIRFNQLQDEICEFYRLKGESGEEC